MTTHSTSSSAKASAAHAADAMWQAMDDLRHTVERKVATRMGKGDVRSAILVLLAEEPMHGYQIIRKIEEHTEGAWKPSAGSIYPTLQLLADEGLVTASPANDRKVYSLTEEGREVAAAAQAPWAPAEPKSASGFSVLSKAGMDLAGAVTSAIRSGTAEQQAQAVEVLDTARRKIYSILAND
jgi:DNA-binding PadR family transcriptional regulator